MICDDESDENNRSGSSFDKGYKGSKEERKEETNICLGPFMTKRRRDHLSLKT